MTGTNDTSDGRAGADRSGLWLPILIIVLCCGVEICLQVAARADLAPRLRATTFENGAFWAGLLWRWQPNYELQPYTMFLSYGFLHGGIMHLAVNMITLWSLSLGVLDRVRPSGFAVLYFGAMIGGGAAYAVLTTTPAPMVGASGALFGLAGGLLAWDYVDRSTRKDALRPVARTVGILILLNVVMWWALDGHLAWQAHLGGFVAGWILALLINPHPLVPDLDDNG
ncbi:rhomboid family intramembrane serine protease [uncultured Tateyamaria sp.]|uniref:rhomboid family intramembrane serine protease n=1 Tax=uncultured Tateyamaria sp. TaxID=455651 RepID=UPI00260A1EE8|nr:rhomboid family intramembrane serine protease [uncultured Tateyamaria sp.]